MAHTISIAKKTVIGDLRACWGTITISSYTSSGETVSTADFDFSSDVLWMATETSSNGFATRWDGTKVRAYGDSGDSSKNPLTEPTETPNVGAVKFMAVGV